MTNGDSPRPSARRSSVAMLWQTEQSAVRSDGETTGGLQPQPHG